LLRSVFQHAAFDSRTYCVSLRDSALSVVYGRGIFRISLTWGLLPGP
jgi:hypothetical protein